MSAARPVHVGVAKVCAHSILFTARISYCVLDFGWLKTASKTCSSILDGGEATVPYKDAPAQDPMECSDSFVDGLGAS